MRPKPRPRRERAGSQNLDSLLDTMANVVGILIVLMAVIQLTVGDAMERIRVFDSEEGIALARERSDLEVELASLGPASLANSRSLERLMARLRALIADPDAARMRSDATTAAATVSARKAEATRIEQSNADKRRRLTALRVRVTERDASAKRSAAAELRLPDPRPAPPQADRVVFLVRYGRVLFPRLSQLEADLNAAIRTWASAGNSIRGFGARDLGDHLRERDLGNEWLRWQLLEVGGQPVARLHWRDTGAGDDLAHLLAAGTESENGFRASLGSLDPKRHFLRFWVWGDSFEVYLEARRIAESAGFAVGWVPIPAGNPLQGSLGRPILPAAPVD